MVILCLLCIKVSWKIGENVKKGGSDLSGKRKEDMFKE